MDFAELDRLMGEDPDDRADRDAHGFAEDDDWQDETLLCRNGCGLSYKEIVGGKIRKCSAMVEPVTVDQLKAAIKAAGVSYVDEYSIDCDADEFWAVIAEALEQE